MKKDFVIDSSNIDRLFASLKRKTDGLTPRYFIIALEIDRKKYKGYGRPRKSDYKYPDFIRRSEYLSKVIK